ncbi:MAG: hypothetical protein QM713_15830 [Arachnia sp.]
MSLASSPPPGTPTPFAITKWAAVNRRKVESLVWRNEEAGTITARLIAPDAAPLYAKWSPHDLLPEAERLSWLSSRHPSPRMVDFEELDDGWLIVTLGLPGENAVVPRWKAKPDVAARAIGEGLGLLHSLDPADCLFETPEWIGYQDDVDQLVVVQGDACAPNTLLTDDGAFLAHVDVGDLGVADRWADLAIASWSLEWNYGPGHDAAFWDGYGIAPDWDRIAHYRHLWGEN